MDEIFRALSDPSRRSLLDDLNRRNGQTLGELCSGLSMARQSVSKHLAILEHANLISTVKRGREKLHYLNAEPINAIADRWINRYDQRRAAALADLKSALEHNPMDNSGTDEDFVYTTYIKTTPEKLWQALTEPAFIKQYWGIELISDWKVGSTIDWQVAGVTISEPEQVVLISDKPRKLSFTWHTVTEEFGKAINADPQEVADMAAEKRSTATFELEQQGDVVKLTLIHSGFPKDSALRAGVSQGWQPILSSLKTLLETGTPLPAE
ncbi:MAG: metalloregulator ArsR/SmtB family transcription factor [Renibacterium salmoninarum]|nr:metalloregulator ArsR/SmtB family transcription factor [Renibacterium salmoninarum]